MPAQMQINKEQHILFLTLSTFGTIGGIQKVCRTLCKVLSDLDGVEMPITVRSLCDHSKDLDERYLHNSQFKGFGYHRFLFTLEAIFQGLKTNTLLISHVNLISVALIIKICNPKLKLIMLAHGTEIWRPLSSWKTKFIKKNMQVWAVSQYTATQIIQKHQIDPANVYVVNNCLDPFFEVPKNFNQSSRLLKKYNLKHKQPILLVISRLTYHDKGKGYDLLIPCIVDLVKEFPNLCYLIAGQAEQRETARLQQLILNHGVQSHVQLIGFIPEKELIEHYLLASIFIMTSKKEGFGLVYIEAAACGRKIICGNDDGSRDAILNGKLGQSIDPENPDELKKAIRQHLRNTDQHQEIHIQDTCVKNFNYPQYKERLKVLLNAN